MPIKLTEDVMGNRTSVNLEENFKKNQDFITQISKIKMEQQIQMQVQMRERDVALQIAKNRDICNWLLTFYVVATTGLFTGFRRTKRSYILAPLLPLTFLVAFQTDLAYGNKLNRIQQEAENIMMFESHLLDLPCEAPTASSIDQARMENEEKIKMHPSTM